MWQTLQRHGAGNDAQCVCHDTGPHTRGATPGVHALGTCAWGPKLHVGRAPDVVGRRGAVPLFVQNGDSVAVAHFAHVFGVSGAQSARDRHCHMGDDASVAKVCRGPRALFAVEASDVGIRSGAAYVFTRTKQECVAYAAAND